MTWAQRNQTVADRSLPKLSIRSSLTLTLINSGLGQLDTYLDALTHLEQPIALPRSVNNITNFTTTISKKQNK